MALIFKLLKNKWITPPNDPQESFEGRNVIITGANSGIGFEAAAKFSTLGASKIILAVRDQTKGGVAKAAIEARTGKKGQMEVWELDMNSYDSILAFAERAKALDHLDVAILNAGVRRVPFVQSKYGWEEDLQVNTLSTVLLGLLILPKLKEAKKITAKLPVLEFTNSGLHQSAQIAPAMREAANILEAHNTKETFNPGAQYGLSKLFLMYATNKIAAETSSGDVIITSVCPGAVGTDLGRDYNGISIKIGLAIISAIFMRKPEQGARSVVSGTTLGERSHGRFWQHDVIQPIAPSVAGEGNKRTAEKIWIEIVTALAKDVPAVAELTNRTHSGHPSWMPTPPFRRKPSPHGASSFLRYLFPHTRRRARAHLSKFRHETLAKLKHRTQSQIYRYILYRQAPKLKKGPGVLQRLRGHTKKLLGTSYLENEARLRRQHMIQPRDSDNSYRSSMSGQNSGQPREPGARRRKLAGYLRAANELRQSYQQQYAPGWSRRETSYDYEDDTPGGFPDAAVVRSGEEEMMLFPSYARKHVKSKPQAEPGTIQETPGDGRDVRDSTGAGDAEFWKQQWDNYEDDNAVVDVDIRGWIYSPHKGQMTRKQRLFIGLARQLVGIQAPPAGTKPTSSSISPVSSREPSPGHMSHRERAQVRQAQRDEMLTAKEAEEILRRGEQEAEVAQKGGYSEKPPPDDSDNADLYRSQSRHSVRSVDSRGDLRPQQLSHTPSNSSLKSEENITPIQKRGSWNQPANMSPAELAEANTHLMARLRHFLAIPMANTPISVFFYNDEISKQRTVYTNPSGHFNVQAALDFVPTHVRILASDKLSATEEIIITEPRGVSVISDIDDTIKHSAISSGAREIFRNAFIRELGDLTIDGVKEWYNKMAAMGVKFHYVSNSPWQLFPVISKYFEMAGLPPGSFHLKQYSGMLQGIFEPVAERKKSTLDKIARDFPERSFILVGDSGEADLEVYTDFVLENPGRVLAVFIRDVTTPVGGGFFDPSVGPMPSDRSPSASQSGSGSTPSRFTSSSGAGGDDDPELRAAIEASLRDMEEENRKRTSSSSPYHDEDHLERRPKLRPRKTQPAPPEPVEKLIDLSDEEPESLPALRRISTDTNTEFCAPSGPVASPATGKSPPMPPKKPIALRSSVPSSPSKAPPPPKPRRPSSTVHQSSPLSNQVSQPSNSQPAPKPSLSPSQQSYSGMARQTLASVYNNLPSASSYLHSSSNQPNTTTESARSFSTSSDSSSGIKKAAPPPPPPRRGISSYPAAAASYAGGKAASAWSNAPSIPHPSTRPYLSAGDRANSYSMTASAQYPIRNNGSLGMNGNGNEGQNGPNGVEGMNKKEVLWRQRWARAERVLGEKRVVLKSWRVGTDVLAETERLIKGAEKKHKECENGSKSR
ncbi:hypothetical protein K469DRAFT_657234 [Zopfia rhizophila CBS 207.26]|uniref:Phosphatidate phosphatase APP1 catalytic domain-containing protein n=1 Tax=Zopfia rhizophila CBS 207.26 TaxID=1314779 RepID=A0A6A6EF86_9PEZI|nr:hypothetical protein K469DRAFT_657234 [Zopfia rhizophila CBS 207.26]